MILCDICASSCFATFIHDCFIYSLSHLHRFHHILTGTLQPIFSSLSIYFFVLVTPSPYRVLQSTGSLPTDSDVGASLPQTQNQTILALLHPRTPRHVPPSFETPPLVISSDARYYGIRGHLSNRHFDGFWRASSNRTSQHLHWKTGT